LQQLLVRVLTFAQSTLARVGELDCPLSRRLSLI